MVSQLISTLIRKMFEYLTVKEMAISRMLNKVTNEFCNEEELWKKKIFRDYGVTKMYGKTWKQTGVEMAKCNMINLNDKWANGKTYKQLLDDTLKTGFDTLDKEQIHLISVAAKVSKENIYVLIYEIESMKNDDYTNIGFDNDTFRKLQHICSREMRIVYSAAVSVQNSNLYLPGEVYYYNISVKPNPFLLSLVDPIVYVMQFSAFSSEDLHRIYPLIDSFWELNIRAM